MVREDGGWEDDIWNKSVGKDWVAGIEVEIMGGRGWWQGELWRSMGSRESCGDDGWQGVEKNFLVL